MFVSILSEASRPQAPSTVPDYFRDLNLDQIVDGITAGREEYDLRPFYATPLPSLDEVSFRQEVMRDLEIREVRECFESFAGGMRSMRQMLATSAKLYEELQKQRWLLRATQTYCDTLQELGDALAGLTLNSRGLLAFRSYLDGYLNLNQFILMRDTGRQIAGDLGALHYSVIVRSGGLIVRGYENERDYSEEVLETFDKFRQGAAKDYRIQFDTSIGMNSVEARIVEFVARLNPDLFGRMEEFCHQHRDYLDSTLGRFDREMQFYLSYLAYIGALRSKGLEFCYPSLTVQDKAVAAETGFDLALASQLAAKGKAVITNDFHLGERERIFLVTGPNQGGKTTFARMFGQMHHLAALGLPVPGRAARLFLCDRIFTHFEREENIENLRGKLQDDLVRIHATLEQATSHSIVIMNEIFNSTALADAVFLAEKVIRRIADMGSLCVCVSFLDELASISDTMVSMSSMVVPENPAERTYKVVRKSPDGRSYALSIAEKYRLTHDAVLARIRA